MLLVNVYGFDINETSCVTGIYVTTVATTTTIVVVVVVVAANKNAIRSTIQEICVHGFCENIA